MRIAVRSVVYSRYVTAEALLEHGVQFGGQLIGLVHTDANFSCGADNDSERHKWQHVCQQTDCTALLHDQPVGASRFDHRQMCVRLAAELVAVDSMRCAIAGILCGHSADLVRSHNQAVGNQRHG